jgi:branched-subunit amino acid transport protein
MWLLIVGLALVSFATRAVFIFPGGRFRLGATFERVLRFAPAAALTAIIMPDITRTTDFATLTPDYPRLVAGLAAFVVAAATRNILLTIVIGVAVLAVGRMF